MKVGEVFMVESCFIFENESLWVFVDGDMKIGWEWEGKGREENRAHWTGSRMFRGDFTEVSWRESEIGEVYQERTVGTLYQSVFQGDSTGADGADLQGLGWVECHC